MLAKVSDRVGSFRFLPWLALVVPLVMAGIDLAGGSYTRTLFNFGVCFLMYTYRIYGLWAIQLVVIPLAFVLFPAGFFLQLLSFADLVVRSMGRFVGEQTLLCAWSGVEPAACAPVLVTFHLGHLLLVVLALKVGPVAFEKVVIWYRAGLAWFEDRLAS